MAVQSVVGGVYLLTGKPYWLAASNPEANMNVLFAELLTSELDPPSMRTRALGLNGTLRPAFDAWFSRCVSREPAQRFQSAGEAVRELALALDTADSSPDSPVLAKARTMLAGRYHIDQSLPPTRASQTPDAAAPVQGQSAGASRAELPALSHSQGNGANFNPAPIVYGALGVALLSVIVVAVVLLRPQPSSEVRPVVAAVSVIHQGSTTPPAASPAPLPVVSLAASSAPTPPATPPVALGNKARPTPTTAATPPPSAPPAPATKVDPLDTR